MTGIAEMLGQASVLHRGGRLAEAEDGYRKVLELQPGNVDALGLMGVLYGQTGRSALAVETLRRAAAGRPGDASLLANFGEALRNAGKLDEAIAVLRAACERQPTLAAAHSALGTALGAKGQPQMGMASLLRAIELAPQDPVPHFNYGGLLREAGRTEEAMDAYVTVLRLDPARTAAYRNLALTLQDQGRFDDALTALEKAAALDPTSAEDRLNCGALLYQLGRDEEAIAAFDLAAALDPGDARPIVNRGLVHIRQGRFEQGWADYNRRFEVIQDGLIGVAPGRPVWRGEPLHGRTILLQGEQGNGDILQFVRYAPLVAARGGRVLLSVLPGLQRLLARVDGVAAVFGPGDPPPPVDFVCPLLNLPAVFGTTVASVPADIPYLRPEPVAAAQWQGLRRNGSLNVGVVWAGDPRRDRPGANSVDRRRSLHLNALAGLAAVDGVTFFSLQKGEPAAQLARPPAGLTLIDVMDRMQDFDATAALVASLDLVITVDTAVAHLAGGLGVPVWVMSRFDGCWRWLTGRDDTPWYPNMRLFRQARPGAWDEVIARVVKELQDLAG